MHQKTNIVENPKDGRSLDRLIECYLADPGGLSLEEQREIYQHFLELMNESEISHSQAQMFQQGVETLDRELERARQGDTGYLVTDRGTYRKRETEMRKVPIGQLVPNAENVDLFRDMEGEDFEQLKSSIQELGLIQPIIVDPEMRVICGHQRLRAAKAIGLDSVPVVVQWVGEQEQRVVMAIEENIRRRQFQPSEMARAIKKLVELKERKQKVKLVAQEVGLSPSQVYLYRGLDFLIPELSSLLDGGTLTQPVALQIAQLDEVVQRELYQALGGRITKALEEQKAVEFETIHAGLLTEFNDLSAEVTKLKEREVEQKTKLGEMQERLDRAEFKVGDELKAKKLLEEELEKIRAEMYQKVQEKQALIDKLTKNVEPKVVPPQDYQAIKAENAKLKATLKELQPAPAKAVQQPEAVMAELHELIVGRLLPIDLKILKGKLSPQHKDQLKVFIPKLDGWMADLKQLVLGPVQEKKRS